MPQTHPYLTKGLDGCPAALVHEAVRESRVLPYGIRQVWSGALLRGPGYTVSQAGGDNVWLHRAIYAAPAGSVIVAATDDPAFGYWGELMARAALSRGLAGLVIQGGVRDVDALESLGFPVFASAICMRGTSKDPECRGALGDPIFLGDAPVCTGDLLVGDRDGVVVVPGAALATVERRVRAREAEERRLREGLAAGDRLPDLLRGARE